MYNDQRNEIIGLFISYEEPCTFRGGLFRIVLGDVLGVGLDSSGRHEYTI